MAKKRTADPVRLAEAIRKVRAGEWLISDAAGFCGISEYMMTQAIAQFGDGVPLKPADKPANVSSLDKALEAGGCPVPNKPTPSSTPGQPPPPVKPVVPNDKYCVEIVGMTKKLTVLGGGMIMGISPLDERLTKVGEMSPDLITATEAAANDLAPILKRWFPEGSALLAFAVALMFDGLGTFMVMKELKVEYKGKRIAEQEKAKKEPTVEQVARKAGGLPSNGPVNRESWMKNIRRFP